MLLFSVQRAAKEVRSTMPETAGSFGQDPVSMRANGNATAVVLALFTLATTGLLATQIFSASIGSDEVFLRLSIAIALVAGAYAISRNLRRRITNAKAPWWNIGAKLDDPSWEDVLRMTLGESGDDPVTYEGKPNVDAAIGKAILIYVVVFSLIFEAFAVLLSGPITPKLVRAVATTSSELTKIQTLSLELNANLTALLALIAAALSIYFTHRQLQAKVKADSRQSWIDKLRAHIAHFIALADAEKGVSGNGSERRQRLREFTSRRIEMELMLNPSEKDHRLLSYLGLKLAFYQHGQHAFQKIQDVRNLESAIRIDPSNAAKPDDWNKLIGTIPDPDGEDERDREQECNDLIGYAIRLAHVVLKREWERVKATR